MKCRKCNATIQKGAKYCNQCGSKIDSNRGNINPLKIFIIICMFLFCVVCLKMIVQQLRYSNFLQLAKDSEKNEQYIDALVYCGMASHIKPKEEEPYLKMADDYMQRSESNQAFAVLNIGKSKASEQEKIYARQEEIKSFADEDVMTKEIAIPEYTKANGFIGKKAAKGLIQELKEYYGTDYNAYGEIAQYYKGYYYFIDKNTIYRTKQDETTKEVIHSIDENFELIFLKVVNDKIFYSYDHDNDMLFTICSINLDGTNEKTYTSCFHPRFLIFQGWLYYHNWNMDYSDIKTKKMKMQRDKTALEVGDITAIDLIIKGQYFYRDDNNHIKKVSIKNHKESEELVCIPLEIKKNNFDKDTHVTVEGNIDNKYIFYSITWRKNDNEKAALYRYDLEKQEELKIDQRNGSYGIMEIKDDWLYIAGYDNDYNYTLYRINIINEKKEIIGRSENFVGFFTICENKMIIEMQNSHDESKTLFLDPEDLASNQAKIDLLD